MEATIVHLHKATDAEDAYALCVAGDKRESWRAERGFGQNFEKVWSVELQSDRRPNQLEVDWDAVLDRAIEAFNLSDPVIANFQWPTQQQSV
jgi:hypothetical protein